MGITFRNQLTALKSSLTGFDTVSHENKLTNLKNLHHCPLVLNKDLAAYLDTLLFIIAYPGHISQLSLAEKELLRVTRFLKQKVQGGRPYRFNTGAPFTQIKTRFSHDMVRWLMSHPDCQVTLDAFRKDSIPLNDILRITLPTLERSETTAGYTNIELMDALRIPVHKRLQFLLDEFSRLDQDPFIKDLLFERLSPLVCVTPRNKYFSTAYNRLQSLEPYFHNQLLKKIDPRPILDSPVPGSTNLGPAELNKMIRVVKNAMALNARETDPCTYMDERSFRWYKLERGLSIAIFSMVPERQLPLESYVGYTAFKNGLPVAYGGAWIFGERANFGINIFRPYRNGESAYIMAQLLRLYRHVFNINYFEVEPYQYGLDNPEGIASGAFWFYYWFGFRPLDKQLALLAKQEAEKIKTRKNYRTSAKVLTEFTGSNIALSLNRKIPPRVPDIVVKVTSMIARTYKNNRLFAEKECRQRFLDKTKMKVPSTKEENLVLTEVALWAEAMKITTPAKLNLMVEMIRTKPNDVFAYQEVLLRFYTS